jgi:competence protein ComEA
MPSSTYQLHSGGCKLLEGERGTTFTAKEDRMKKSTRQIVTVILLFTFLLGAGIGPALAQQQVKVNINKASVDELSTLKRIGPSYAQRIVDYRKQNGPFEKPEDIMKVRGIGIKTFEANKDFISCE